MLQTSCRVELGRWAVCVRFLYSPLALAAGAARNALLRCRAVSNLLGAAERNSGGILRFLAKERRNLELEEGKELLKRG